MLVYQRVIYGVQNIFYLRRCWRITGFWGTRTMDKPRPVATMWCHWTLGIRESVLMPCRKAGPSLQNQWGVERSWNWMNWMMEQCKGTPTISTVVKTPWVSWQVFHQSFGGFQSCGLATWATFGDVDAWLCWPGVDRWTQRHAACAAGAAIEISNFSARRQKIGSAGRLCTGYGHRDSLRSWTSQQVISCTVKYCKYGLP